MRNTSISMREQRTQESYGLWSLPAHPHGIEYSIQVIEEITAAANAGYNKFPRGGVEVGGVLFGTRDKSGTRIVASRPMQCQYTFGPSFALSGDEHEALTEMLRAYRKDPGLRELVPVGWYHSHTRNELALSDADLHLHNRHFTEPWQVALLLRPETGKATKLGVFVKSEKGTLVSKPALTVEVQNSSVPDASPQIALVGGPANGGAKGNGVTTLPEWLRQPPQRSRPNTGRLKKVAKVAGIAVGVVAVIGLAVAGVGPQVKKNLSDGQGYWHQVTTYWGSFLEPNPAPSADLQLAGAGEELTIRWDATADALKQTESARLLIADGDRKSEMVLDRDALLKSSTQYRRTSENVIVRMAAEGNSGSPFVETARFLGRPVQVQPASANEAARQVEALRQEKARLETALRAQARNNEALATNLTALEEEAKAEPPPAAEEPPVEPAKQATPAEEPKPAPPQPPPAPVLLEQRPDSGSSTASSQSEQQGSATPTPTYTGPTSGVVIWTGVLSNGSVLTIQGRQASIGSVTGRLPGSPVRVSVYQAELSSAGLVVFTGDQKHAGAGVKEPPSARNSWTQTIYKFVPDRTRTVELVQRPSPDNSWNFVAVRANGQTLTTVVISWELIR